MVGGCTESSACWGFILGCFSICVEMKGWVFVSTCDSSCPRLPDGLFFCHLVFDYWLIGGVGERGRCLKAFRSCSTLFSCLLLTVPPPLHRSTWPLPSSSPLGWFDGIELQPWTWGTCHTVTPTEQHWQCNNTIFYNSLIINILSWAYLHLRDTDLKMIGIHTHIRFSLFWYISTLILGMSINSRIDLHTWKRVFTVSLSSFQTCLVGDWSALWWRLISILISLCFSSSSSASWPPTAPIPPTGFHLTPLPPDHGHTGCLYIGSFGQMIADSLTRHTRTLDGYEDKWTYEPTDLPSHIRQSQSQHWDSASSFKMIRRPLVQFPTIYQ